MELNIMKNKIFLSCLLVILTFSSFGQIPPVNEEWGYLLTTPKSYVAGFAAIPPVIDGAVDDEVWEKAVWSDVFGDIEGDAKPAPYYATRVKMLWDNEYLYIAAALQDEHVWANLTGRDEVVFYDNDFEVFIDPANTTHRYFEYEINALNTVFDLFLPKPYRNGSGALISWDSKGLKHAVQIQGTLNNPNDKDSGWTVEMAIPFADVTIGNHPHIPKDGEIWRINFSRVQWETEIADGKYVKKKDKDGKTLPENNWVWSPQGVVNMHLPERWGYLQFATKEASTDLPLFELPYSEMQRQYLWLVYYKQQAYKRNNGHYASSLGDLGISDTQLVDGVGNSLSMEATSSLFFCRIKDAEGKTVSINNEGYIN